LIREKIAMPTEKDYLRRIERQQRGVPVSVQKAIFIVVAFMILYAVVSGVFR
jgi:hypothetical protein